MGRHDPLGRFTGIADLYAEHRPEYPGGAIDFVMTHCGLARGSVLVDVGCGTGISSRAFAQRGLQVIGVEPNDEMRARAEVEAVPSGSGAPSYRGGRAEATGLPDGIADAALAAQAFHWFEPEAALREFHRILKPHGWAVIMYNERDVADPFTAAYSAIVRAVRDSTAIEASRIRAGAVLLRSTLFKDAVQVAFPNEQVLDEGGLLGRAFSASYAPREPDRAGQFEREVRRVFSAFQRRGKVTLRYMTSIFLARRRGDSWIAASAR